MTLIRFDRRSVQIQVSRAALSAAAENAHAANANARDAIDRALGHVFAGNRAGIIHELERIGFEVGERTTALTHLTNLAETATACPDHVTAPGHGRAA